MKFHPDPEDLEAYVLFRPLLAVVDAVEEHLLVCETCRLFCAEIERKAGAVRDAFTNGRAN